MLARNVGKNTHAPAPFAPGLKKDTGAGLTMAMERGAGTAGYFDVMYCELVDTRPTKPDAAISSVYLRWGHNYGIVSGLFQ